MWPRVKDPYYRTCAADLQPGVRKGQFMRQEGARVHNHRPDVFYWPGPCDAGTPRDGMWGMPFPYPPPGRPPDSGETS